MSDETQPDRLAINQASAHWIRMRLGDNNICPEYRYWLQTELIKTERTIVELREEKYGERERAA